MNNKAYTTILPGCITASSGQVLVSTANGYAWSTMTKTYREYLNQYMLAPLVALQKVASDADFGDNSKNYCDAVEYLIKMKQIPLIALIYGE